ncbi:MAG TPA: endopeptidase La [Kouleothrix sp.]|uniref:endopeptidase La n=1 Tax=Kouleothrix sp. TaxID=2779161 RepID=UPI002D188DD9|nr:endopeptidase La [Kouleothrix sp.]HRC75132.1 endopeptidase La [Kouleothrix sp.]
MSEADHSGAPEPQPDEAHAPAIPDELAILPLFNMVIYPMTVIPLAVGQAQSIRLIDDAVLGERMIGLVALRSEQERPEAIGADDFFPVGTAAMVHRLLRLPDDTLRVAVQGLERIEIVEILQTEPYIRARVRVLADETSDDIETQALMRNLVGLAQQILQLLPNTSEELQTQIFNEDDPRRLAYLLAVSLLFRSSVAERQEVLALPSVRAKLARLQEILTRELSVLQLGQRLQSQVQSGIDKSQREYLLREQLRAIREELGEGDENAAEVARLRDAIAAAGMSAEAQAQAEREVARLALMPPAAAEYGVIRTYLETLLALPWQARSADQLDIAHAQQVLDEDHYDLEEIKRRILEYLAVRALRRERLGEDAINPKGAILCFVGPPGVGKTSLGRSIARAMGRQFIRLSLGGVRDEAEVRGHRRTYIGAMPGSIIQTIRRAAVNNPVFMLDEIDKLGADFRGDPSSALLEVLDPEQNTSFRDHYLDVAWDLSPVLFIATANTLQTIPPPLLDRMEVIQLSGYTARQKLEIARRYLVPEQLAEHALGDADAEVTDAALTVAIEEYTREAGVRNLEREIANICRKVAVQIAKKNERPPTNDERSSDLLVHAPSADQSPSSFVPRPLFPVVVDADKAREYLGRRRFFAEVPERIDRPGIVTGLVWTPVGGDIIFIEATRMPGGKGFTLTGQLGDVMRESARAALSYVRAEAARLGVDPQFFERSDLHVHVPAGAIPKDGPSAGVAMATALVSLLSGRPVRDSVAMTGEITLRGKVLPIGGVKEKVLAGHRAGLRTIILPKRNETDLDEIPGEVRRELTFVLADRVEEVLAAALSAQTTEPPEADSLATDTTALADSAHMAEH